MVRDGSSLGCCLVSDKGIEGLVIHENPGCSRVVEAEDAEFSLPSSVVARILLSLLIKSPSTLDI